MKIAMPIDDSVVLFTAIESMRYNPLLKSVIVRTVSGVDHSLNVEDEIEADIIIKNILQDIVLAK